MAMARRQNGKQRRAAIGDAVRQGRLSELLRLAGGDSDPLPLDAAIPLQTLRLSGTEAIIASGVANGSTDREIVDTLHRQRIGLFERDLKAATTGLREEFGLERNVGHSHRAAARWLLVRCLFTSGAIPLRTDIRPTPDVPNDMCAAIGLASHGLEYEEIATALAMPTRSVARLIIEADNNLGIEGRHNTARTISTAFQTGVLSTKPEVILPPGDLARRVGAMVRSSVPELPPA